MPLKPCAEPGCPELVTTGRCPTHTTEANARYRHRGRRKWYATKRWRILSNRVLAEEPLCDCGCGGLAEEVDHIEPVEDAPTEAEALRRMWSRSNLKARCHASHSRKTQADVATRTFT